VWKISLSNGTIIQQPMNYTYWKENQPDYSWAGNGPQSCMNIVYDWGYHWNDDRCDIIVCSLCEIDP